MKALAYLFCAEATVLLTDGASPSGIANNGLALLAAPTFLTAAAFSAVWEVVRLVSSPQGLVP